MSTVPLRDMLPSIIGKRSKNIPEIADAANRARQTVDSLIRRLHSKGDIHIKRWKRGNTGPYIPYYIWGPGKDAKRPAPMPRAEVYKRYNNSESGKARRSAWIKSERGQEYRQNARKAQWARQKFETGGLAAIDPLLAAIMGRPSTKEQTCT